MYNINGTGVTKVLSSLHWQELFSSYDIVLLQETRSVLADPLHGILSSSHQHYVFCSTGQHATPGHGLAIYLSHSVGHQYTIRVRKLSAYIQWLELSSSSTGKFVIGNVYVPQGQQQGREAVYDELYTDISGFQAAGSQVVCCGDFNAHVGSLEDRPLDPEGHPVAVSCRRAPCQLSAPNPSGEQLVQLCQSTGTFLCTGRGPRGADPEAVQPSYVGAGERIARTRPDHCLLSASLAPVMAHHGVLSHVDGSDHLPLTLTLHLPRALAPLPSVSEPVLLYRLHWDASKAAEFTAALHDHPEVLCLRDRCEAAIASPATLDVAIAYLQAALYKAAEVAGLRFSEVSAQPRRRRVHQPWFDAECKAAHRAGRATPATSLQRRQFRALLQRKQRQYAYRQYQHFQELCSKDPAYFWRALRRGLAQSSPVVPTAADFTAHFSQVFAGPGPTQLPELAPPTPEELAAIFDDDAIRDAFRRLRRSASPGKPGIPVPVLAALPVRPLLEDLLRAVYAAGPEPPLMNVALLNPVYKRNDLALSANYRPITVSSVLHKVYANCIGRAVHQAHTQYSAEHGDAFPRQAGFLPQRSTLHNMFVLQHLAHHHERLQKPLYCVLLDVKAAYDSTQHSKMVETLLQLQFPQHLVRGVAGMYVGLHYQVLANGTLAEPFGVGIGVKQGCPLSPILYNLYVQPLSAVLGGTGLGPTFPGVEGSQPDFHYADDVALVAESLPDLQALLVHTVASLAARDLKLSVDKCVGLLLGATDFTDRHHQVTLGGQPLKWSGDAKGERYLGLMFSPTASAVKMAEHRAACLTSSFYATTSHMRAAPDFPSAVPTFLQLLHTVMEPAGLYGCELWGLLSLPGLTSEAPLSLQQFYALTDPLEKTRCSLLRRWLKLPVGVPKLALLHELGCEPLVHSYVRRAVRFYNDLLDLPASSAYRGALRENVTEAFAAWHAGSRVRDRPCNFVRALFQVLRTLLPSERGLQGCFRREEALDAVVVDQALQDRYCEFVAAAARVLEGPGSRMGLYFREVVLHALGDVPPYFALRVSHGVMTRCLRFRLGCHHLRVHTGRWLQPPLPRVERTCIRCTCQSVDDEAHCLLSCAHPGLASLRTALASTLQPEVRLAALRTYKQFWQALAVCGPSRGQAVAHFIATCVRVSWQCHQSGGSSGPFVLSPAGSEQLDFLDDDSDGAEFVEVFSEESDGEELVEVMAVA